LCISVAPSDPTYSGVFFRLILAAGAQIGVADWVGLPPVGLMLLVASFISQDTARRRQSPYGSLAALRGAVV
jgi:hypothetical protein